MSLMMACAPSSATDPGPLGSALPGDQQNPYGEPYPTATIGTMASTHDPTTGQVGRRGATMPNYVFSGFPDGDPSAGMQRVKFADFYDPKGTLGYKLIHIQGAGAWCSYCKTEMQLLQKVETLIKARGVRLITILVQGDVLGKPSAESDLRYWVELYKPSYAQLIDPGARNVGAFFDPAAMPWITYLDPRTMEILRSGVGLKPGANENDVLQEMDAWIQFLDAHPAATR